VSAINYVKGAMTVQNEFTGFKNIHKTTNSEWIPNYSKLRRSISTIKNIENIKLRAERQLGHY
jgi:hypothetical protein